MSYHYVGEIFVIQLCNKLKNKSVKGAEVISEVFWAAVVSWCLQGYHTWFFSSNRYKNKTGDEWSTFIAFCHNNSIQFKFICIALFYVTNHCRAALQEIYNKCNRNKYCKMVR